jgi:flagellar basal-body rod modification protein FlgD
MTTTNAVLPTTTSAAAGQQVQSGLASLTNNFQTFLGLLTTQLKNQDPLSPLDTNQFTQQLVQMSGVQQQLLTNSLLNTLVAQGQGGLQGGVAYIGKTVEATSPDRSLSSGNATWSYSLPAQASTAQLSITDSTGKVVWSGSAPDLTSGVHDFSWNGKTTAGVQLPDGGTYTLTVTAKDGSGTAMTTQVLTRGTVTAVTENSGQAYLSLGSTGSVPLSSVVGVQNATTTP